MISTMVGISIAKSVAEDDGGLELGGGPGTSIENGGIPHDGVDDSDSADATDAGIGSNLRVVDCDSLDIPSPVPSCPDGSVQAVDGDVLDGKLTSGPMFPPLIKRLPINSHVAL
jgi:hypothetical protein